MTLQLRSYLRGRYGDQPVYSRYAVGGGPGWVTAHEPLGLEDLDDVPLVAMPTGGSNQATAVGGGPVSVIPAGSLLGTLGGMFPGVKASLPAVPTSTPPSSGGAVAKVVAADGSVGNGDKTYYAEVINPEHPQYEASRTAVEQGTALDAQRFAQSVQEGIRQAVTGAQSSSWLGSLLGAGIGGPGLGTGALPGVLGQRAADYFGTLNLPPGAVWTGRGLQVTDYARDPAWQRLATDVDLAGRETAERVLGVAQPQLDGIRRLLEHRAAQVQATSEHDRITQLERYQREVLGLLQHIAIRTGARTPLDFAISSFANQSGAQQWRRY